MPPTRGNLLKCRDLSDSRAPAYATAAVMGAGFVFSMAMCWPGHLSYDSVVQLLEGRTALYSGWHPPIMSWLLGLSDWAMPGAGLFIAVTALAFFLSVASLIRLVPRIAWAGPAVATLCVLTPQFAFYQGIVWKDVLFADATVAGFLAQAHLQRCWNTSAWRYGLVAVSFLSFALATLTRQNGAIVLVAGAVSLLAILRRQTGSWRLAISESASVLLLSALLVTVATAALNTRLLPEAGMSRQLKRLELYDLAGAIARDPLLRSPLLERQDPALLKVLRQDGVRFYSPVRSDWLARSAPLQAALEHVPDATLKRAWHEMILHHPVDYLRARAAAFRWVMLTPNISLCVPYVVGLGGPSQAMQALGLRTRVNRRDEWADAYGKLFMHTPIFSHLTFLSLLMAELAFLIWRRRTPDISMIGMLGGASVFTASFFLISLACDYRYNYVLDLAALATLIYIALDPRLARDGGADRSSASPSR